MDSDIEAILASSAIFDEFNEAQLALVAALCDPLLLEPGAVVVRENEASDDLYIIARGSVVVSIAPEPAHRPDDQIMLAELGAGQAVGEMALVDRGLRSATVVVNKDDTLLLRIRRDHLTALSETYPLLGYRLMRNLAANLAAKIRTTGWLVRQYQLQATTPESQE